MFFRPLCLFILDLVLRKPLAEVAPDNAQVMRRETSTSMHVGANGKAVPPVQIGRHQPKKMFEMDHLQDRFEQNQDIVHPEPEKEFGYYSDQPYGAVVPKQVATVTGDVKSGLHDSCTATMGNKRAMVQCCSMSLSLDQDMSTEPESILRDARTYVQAEQYCENENKRLCTANEFHSGRVKVQDATALMWTSDECDLTTPEGQKALREKQQTLSDKKDTLGRLTYVVGKLEKKEAEMQERLHDILIKHAGAMESAKLPFKVFPQKHLVELQDYNLVVRSSEHKAGTGNLIVGLDHDVKHADNGFVAGEHNALLGTGVSVAGGIDNQAVGKFATVLGGENNRAGKPYSTIAGGSHNTVVGRGAQVGGGNGNLARGMGSVVAGGLKNNAFGKFGVVVAGLNNTASGLASTVLNGRFNEALGSGSGVAEGQFRINSMKGLGV